MKYFLSKKMLLAVTILLPAGYVQAQEVRDTLQLTLDEVLEIVLSESPTIKAAGQEIQLKKEAKKEVYGGLFPEISLTGPYSRTLKKQTMMINFGRESQTIQVGSNNSYNGRPSASLSVFAPTFHKSINLTKSDIKLAVEKAHLSKLGLMDQVTKAYHQLLLAQDSCEVLPQSYVQVETNYEVVKTKYERGTASEHNKIRADVQVRSLKPLVASARNGVSLARSQLQVLMGMDTDVAITTDGNLKDYEMVMFRRQMESNQLNLNNDSDLKQLDLNTDLLKKTLVIQRTNFMSTLATSFNYPYTPLNSDSRMSRYKWFPYSIVGLSLSIPLSKAGNFAEMKQAKIQIQQLVENRTNTQYQLTMQATSYLDNMAANTEQVVSNKEGIVQAEKERLIAQERYRVGKRITLELSDPEMVPIQAQLTYSQSIYDYLVTKADLDQVLGREEITE